MKQNSGSPGAEVSKIVEYHRHSKRYIYSLAVSFLASWNITLLTKYFQCVEPLT